MPDYTEIQKEETLKARVFQDYFDKAIFTYAPNIGNIDFVVTDAQLEKNGLFQAHYLWAEAKKGAADEISMLTQLILTCKKIYDAGVDLPPPFLGCFDAVKIAFVPFHDILPIFAENDMNWNVTPGDYFSEHFIKARGKVAALIAKNIIVFRFAADADKIKKFIETNLLSEPNEIKIPITKNNFPNIYNRWRKEVKPFINVSGERWRKYKKEGILDCDFFRADMMSKEGGSITDRRNIILENDKYKLQKDIEGELFRSDIDFTDGGVAYRRFWNKYGRPPAEEYQQYIIDRRDLLVPQNIREVKGSFFTPKIWVKKSQEYLGKIFGDNWQDEYYIWDCAAGTGNLLAGLKNKYRVWASTLDQPDVDTMHALIDGGLNLLHGHVFQFDFLNDNFDKLPQGLKEIIDNPEKREKLIIYINPPYAEAATAATVYGTGENKAKVSNLLLTHERYANYLGKAGRELFVQFLTRVYFEIGGCKIAEFSKLKTLQSPNFRSFRAVFLARLEKCFVVPAYTFDNVKGKFPIGFKIWDTEKKEEFKETVADVYDENGGYIGEKTYLSCDGVKTINDWLKNFVNTGAALAAMCCKGTDFQNAKYVNVNLPARLKGVGNSKGVTNFTITEKNFAYAAIYYSARHVLPSSWMNDRDQFLYPRDGWEADMEFRNNCLIFFLFNVNTQSAYGVNHWIPFSEMEAGAKEKFTSNFMNRYLKGKTFSPEARALLETGLALYQYYHVKIKENNSASVNASFYDIREFFQGRKENGAMNANSADETYSALMSRLRAAQKIVTAKIAPKIYEYGFLRK